MLILCFSMSLGCETRSVGEDSRPLTVFAASSLTEAFTALGEAFARAERGAPPAFAFAGSQSLRLQIDQGAAADVFASANRSHLDMLQSSGRIATPELLAYNELVLIVPKHNPSEIHTFDDLRRVQRLVIGAPGVPIGQYTDELLQRAATVLGEDFVSSVKKQIVSKEGNVRLVRAKVELGEADAAIVYRTDVSASVQAIQIPKSINVRARYELAPVLPVHNDSVHQWMKFVTSKAGRELLRQHGFTTP
mgnify:FL=1